MIVTSVITTDLALALVRVVVGLVIAAHGAQKVLGVWGGPGLAGWTQGITRMGMRPPVFWAWVSAFAELAGGVAFALGFLLPVVGADQTGSGSDPLATANELGQIGRLLAEAPAGVRAKGGQKHFRCEACGTISHGERQPDKCPTCGGRKFFAADIEQPFVEAGAG